MARERLCGLYGITQGAGLVEGVAAALRGGARLIQYRDKGSDHDRRLDEARQVQALCRAAGAVFIVNDDIDLAHRIGADGVHLGRDDCEVATARALLGPAAVIGVSCYDALARAREAAAAGADYLAFGAFHPSPTKPQAVRATPSLLTDARALGLPLCAIGGITPANGRTLLDAGADMLAAVSGLFDAEDIEAQARAYVALWRDRNGCKRP